MFWTRKISPDDLGRVDRLEERVESLVRRFESLSVENEEFYTKTNRARQRVIKQEADQLRALGGPSLEPQTKAELRARLLRRG